MKNIGPGIQTYLTKSIKTGKCFFLVYDLKDGVVYDIRKKLTIK